MRRPSRSLVGQSALTTLAAVLALVSGLAVDVVVAASFGAGSATDSFFVGARLPLAVATILLIGANQALVPAVSAWLVDLGEEVSGRLAAGVTTVALAVGAAVAVLVAVASGPLCRLLAPGLSPPGVELAAEVLTIMALTLPAAAVAEVLRAYLNARRAYVLPAVVNVVLNLTVVLVVLLGRDASILLVAWGYAAGAILRCVVLAAAAVRRGLALNPMPGLRRRECWSAVRLCSRPLTGAGLAPVVRIAEQAVVSFLPSGSISLLNYAYRLVTGIGGAVLFRSVIVALVPRLTESISRGRHAVARELTALGVRLMLVVSLPLAMATAVLAEPATRLLFQRGRFEASDAALLGLLLTLFATSMPADGVIRAQLAPYFSRLDTRLPLRNSLLGMVVNLALLPIVLLFDGATAALCTVVVAYSLSRWVTVAHAQRHLRRDGLAPQVQLGAVLGLLGPPLVLSAAVMLTLGALLDVYGKGPSAELAFSLAVMVVAGGAALLVPLLARRRTLRRMLRTPPDDPADAGEPNYLSGLASR